MKRNFTIFVHAIHTIFLHVLHVSFDNKYEQICVDIFFVCTNIERWKRMNKEKECKIRNLIDLLKDFALIWNWCWYAISFINLIIADWETHNKSDTYTIRASKNLLMLRKYVHSLFHFISFISITTTTQRHTQKKNELKLPATFTWLFAIWCCISNRFSQNRFNSILSIRIAITNSNSNNVNQIDRRKKQPKSLVYNWKP